MFNQLCAELPSTFDKRMAISGLRLLNPFTSLLKVGRATPSFLAMVAGVGVSTFLSILTISSVKAISLLYKRGQLSSGPAITLNPVIHVLVDLMH